MARSRKPTEGVAPPTNKPFKHTVMGKFSSQLEVEAQCLKELKATKEEIIIEEVPLPGREKWRLDTLVQEGGTRNAGAGTSSWSPVLG